VQDNELRGKPMTKKKAKSRYTLSGPCSNCPFRNDKKFELRPERVIEIAEDLLNGVDFFCHKTVDYSGEEAAVAAKTRACGGAIATLAKSGRSTQMERISGRLGLPIATPDPDASVYSSIEKWVEGMNGTPSATATILGTVEIADYEHCGVVAGDCEDPAGYGGGGGVRGNLETPTCNPFTDSCEHCGYLMCTACRATDTSCVTCEED